MPEYTRNDERTIEMGKDKHGLYVRCWSPNNELDWEIRGVAITDDGMRQTRRAFSKEEQLVEYNRWRD